MKVEDLIKELQEIEDKSLPVILPHCYEDGECAEDGNLFAKGVDIHPTGSSGYEETGCIYITGTY